MLSRFVRDDANQTRKHFFFGSLLILLSFAIGASLIGYSWQTHSVLGSQTIAQTLQTGSGEDQAPGVGSSGQSAGSGELQGGEQGRDGQIEIIDQPRPTEIQVIQQPSPLPQPTQVPIVQQPTPTPIVVSSVPELIEGAGPQTEIVIRNEDNTLVVSTTTNPTHVAIIEPGEALTGQLPSDQPPTSGTESTVETVLTFDPVTQEYIEVPTSYSADDADSNVSVSTSNSSTSSRALTVLSNSVQKVFSVETYFPSDTPEQHNTINLQNTSNSHMYAWLSKYQFQVWPIGTSHLAIYRNGITTLTRYPIALGLSRQSVRLLTEDGYKQLLHYPDSIWQDVSARGSVSEDSHDEPLILTYENEELFYKIQGTSRQLMLAFIPMTTCRRLVVSADTQETESIEACSMKDAVIEAISISLN